jgi:hypothetical protein
LVKRRALAVALEAAALTTLFATLVLLGRRAALALTALAALPTLLFTLLLATLAALPTLLRIVGGRASHRFLQR